MLRDTVKVLKSNVKLGFYSVTAPRVQRKSSTGSQETHCALEGQTQYVMRQP